MRVGYNPHKDQPLAQGDFTHQVIIPVHIPQQDGYFADSLRVLQKCLVDKIDVFVFLVNKIKS